MNDIKLVEIKLRKPNKKNALTLSADLRKAIEQYIDVAEKYKEPFIPNKSLEKLKDRIQKEADDFNTVMQQFGRSIKPIVLPKLPTFSKPFSRPDQNISLEKLYDVESQIEELTNSMKSLIIIQNKVIYCRTCNKILAKISYTLEGEIKCCSCNAMRKIPSKDVLIKPQKTI